MRKKIIIGVLSLIVVTLLFILYLISPLGLGTCLSILDNFTPGSLHYKTATGSILGPIKLSQASYNNKNYSVHAKSIDFDWSLQDIFNHEIKLSYIKGNDITININYNPNDSSKGLLDQTTSVELTKPKKNKYIISIGPAKIDQLTLWINNHRLLELHNIRTTKTVSSDKLDLELISELYEPIKTKIKIHLKGLINRYLFNTTFKNSNSNWSLSGSGDMASVNIKTLHTKLLNGELNGNGTLDWIKKKWKINIKGTKLDLKTINLHLPKAISIAFQGSGSMQSPNQMQYQLSGTLSNKNNHIQFKAHKDKLLNVSWDANLKQLESLSDELTGKLNSKGFITYKGINRASKLV